MVIEKRKERRIKVDLPIEITHPNNPPVLEKIKNISRLGTYLEIDKEISAGTDIDITLEIPVYSEDISLAGKVRCKGNIFRCNLVRELDLKKYYGIGIFFINFQKPIDFDKLSRYIDFLVLKEDGEIKESAKRWRDKKNAAERAKKAKRPK